MYAINHSLSRLAATIPPLDAAPIPDWPGNLDDDPAYLAWLEIQSDVHAMRSAAMADSSRPGLWEV